jgi:hypothetical protein
MAEGERFWGRGAKGDAGRVFGISSILCLVMGINLAMFLLAPKTDLRWGATAGFLAGFGWMPIKPGYLTPGGTVVFKAISASIMPSASLFPATALDRRSPLHPLLSEHRAGTNK